MSLSEIKYSRSLAGVVVTENFGRKIGETEHH